MEQIDSYIMSIVYASVVVSVLMAVIPRGPSKTLAGIVSGFVLILIMCRPLASGMRFDDLARVLKPPENTSTQRDYEDKQDELLKELIADKTSAYILTKAQALGVTCRVTVSLDDGDPPVPAKAYVSAPSAPPDGVRRQLSAILESDCGIPPENQFFHWEQE